MVPSAIESRGLVVYPKADETRAGTAERLRRCAQAGFNFIILKVFAGGRYFGESAAWTSVAGRRPRLSREEDHVARIVEIARMLDLPVYAGFELLEIRERSQFVSTLGQQRPEWFVPAKWKPGAELAKRELGRKSSKGRLSSIRWICPVHPEARRFFGDLMVETLESYPFEGLYLDRVSMPASSEASPREYFPNSALFKKWTALQIAAREKGTPNGDEKKPGDTTVKLSPIDWNEQVSDQILALVNHLRARVYKARAHLTMMAEVAGAPPPEGVDPTDYEPASRVGTVEMDWRRSLDTVIDMIAPSYAVGAGSKLDELRRDLDLLGPEAPLVPVMRLIGDEVPRDAFAAARASSVFGFIVDAGHPLTPEQWREIGKLMPGKAMSVHREPAASLAALQAQTLSLLPKRHDLSEFLAAMDKLLRSAEPGQVEKTRANLVRNLEGLIGERRSNLNLPADVEGPVVRNLGLMIRLHALLVSRGQMLKATPYHFS